MKYIINFIKNIYLIPSHVLSKIFSIFKKARNEPTGPFENQNNTSAAFAFLFSTAIWVFLGYSLTKPYIKFNRVVYACPLDNSYRCRYLEAEYETICTEGEECTYYYKGLKLPNNKYVGFYYCDNSGINRQTCYPLESGTAWILEYRGKSVFRK